MADAPDGYNDSNWELAECAKINFENVTKMNPALKQHPIYTIAKAQLDALCKRLEALDEAA